MNFDTFVEKQTHLYKGYMIRLGTIYKGDEIIMIYPTGLLPTEKILNMVNNLLTN